jgi:hypothetical protein
MRFAYATNYQHGADLSLEADSSSSTLEFPCL